MRSKDNRRRNYFINKKFQTQFILRFCGLVLLGAVISGVALFSYVFVKDTVTTAFVNSRLSIITTADYILPVILGASIIAIVLVSIATAIVVMYLSHRIAGPLFRIEKDLSQISEGDLTLKIILRTNDEIKRLAENINQTNEKIRMKISEAKINLKDLDNQVKELSVSMKDDNAKSKLDDILKTKEKLSKTLNYFKTES